MAQPFSATQLKSLADLGISAFESEVVAELCGLRDQREIIRFYGIPQKVLNRLGVIER